MSRKQFNEHQRWQMARLVGAVRWGQVWFKPPAPVTKATATRVEHKDLVVPRSQLEAQVSAYGVLHSRPRDFATQPESNAEWADRELNRPTSTLNQATAHFAGKPYHWRQTYDSGLRLHAGASPW
jgi:hypothetical protein